MCMHSFDFFKLMWIWGTSICTHSDLLPSNVSVCFLSENNVIEIFSKFINEFICTDDPMGKTQHFKFLRVYVVYENIKHLSTMYVYL